MTSQRVPPALGYESPTEHTVTSALATNHLMHRLSELEQSQRQRQNVGQNELPRGAMNMDDLVSQSGKLGNSGIANVLASIPFEAQWLYIVGVIFCIFNMCLFVTNSILLLIRFRLRPGSFRHSFTDQFEALFIPASLVSIGTIFINICEYGIPHTGTWLLYTMEAMFWIWAVAAVFASAGIYLILWSTLIFPIHTMTPVWVFPAYPLLLTAPFAGNLVNSAVKSGHMDLISGLPIAMAAIAVQGMGFCLSFMILAAFIYRLMTQKLPRDMQRPGVFISIGPSGFTVAGLVHLGRLAADIIPEDFMMAGMTGHAVFIMKLMSSLVGLWLWGLAVWFFIVSVGSFWKYARPEHEAKIGFQMTFFSFVFPNTALITATFQIGRVFNCRPLEIVGCVMAGLLIIVWAIIFGMMIRCVWKRELLWPKEE
ncbi:Malic acid transport protein [Cytospora mali]|uniref:Malic acid transport protein n=1 Tax=Cytospora mali TaxID=578113 RepID=A0A194V9S1_CYTMA|nr:Malic acid transport protein [Valsa mali var. pyri (nom. inval.)]